MSDPVIRLGPLGRAIYSPTELTPMIRPSSVAVVGVSRKESGFGTRTLLNLAEGGYTGTLYAVNPKYAELHGHPCYASVKDLPEPVDCAVVAVKASAVMDVVKECADSGVRSAIVMTSGFGETERVSGAQEQLTLRSIARASGMPVCGPNTQGHVDIGANVGMTFVPDFMVTYDPNLAMNRERSIGIASQSGGLGAHLAHVRNRGVAVSHVLCAGNSCDVTVFDLANYLLNDDNTRAVAVVAEGVEDGSLIAALGRRSRRSGKPVILYHLGHTASGRLAARSHTGSLTAEARVLRTALEEAGIIQVTSLEDLLETTVMLAKTPAPRSDGVAVVSTTGGAGVMCSDAADLAGVPMPPPTPKTTKRLSQVLPDYAASGNPFDPTADALNRRGAYEDVVQSIRDDPTYGAVVLPVSLTLGPTTAPRPAAIADLAPNGATPLVAVWMSGWLEGPGSEVLDASPHVPVFRSATRCFEAIAAWHRWHRFESDGPATALPRKVAEDARLAVDVALGTRRGHITMTEVEARTVLATIDVPFPDARVAHSADEAVSAAEAIGYPVCAKIISDAVLHKAAIGGVRLGLLSARDVRQAFTELAALTPHGVDHGILIAEMVPAGIEMIVGARRDHAFGGVAVCGRGGTRVEVLDEVNLGLAPMSRGRAEQIVAQTLAREDRVTVASSAGLALTDTLIRTAALLEADERIQEIDLNPVAIDPVSQRLVALDALIQLQSPEG